MRNNTYRLSFLIAFLLLSQTSLKSDAFELEKRLRRPVAISTSVDGRWLYTANENSGTISVVDTSTRSVVKELDVGGRLSDIAVLDKSNLLAIDEKNHQLVLLSGGGATWNVTAKLDVAKYPVSLLVDKQTNRCCIASLWSRAVTLVDLSNVNRKPEPQLRIASRVQLLFEPREMCFLNETKNLIVAGAFQNTLAVFETDGLKLVATKQIPGHNIRSLALGHDGQRIFLTQQELNSLARSTRDDVHWGNMVTNQLVSLSVDGLCDPSADVLKNRRVYYLGEPGNAAGDPGPLAISSSGQLAVLLSGVNEVALGDEENDQRFTRVPVGRRPSAIAWTPDGKLFIANKFSDSISIIDASSAKQLADVTLGPQPEPSAAELGEMLFFDSRLSHDGWMSCHSCHTDGHTNGQLNDNLSDGSFQAPKRVLSLLGVSQTGPWAWSGQVETLEQQVKTSIQDTMQGAKPSEEQIAALVAYLKTLPAPPTLAEVNIAEFKDADKIDRGRNLFQSLECHSCHAPPNFTVAQVFDIGLTDASGNHKFNPPSLRGAGRRSAFFHDASAKSLKEVLIDRKHQLNRRLSTAELDLLLHFLRSI